MVCQGDLVETPHCRDASIVDPDRDCRALKCLQLVIFQVLDAIGVSELIAKNRWRIQGTIEFEYPIPPGSDRMGEIAKCVAYCRKCLG